MPRHGASSAKTESGNPPVRRGLPVHLDCIWAPLSRRRRSAFDGFRRRPLRQCDVRELQCSLRVRAARSTRFKNPRDAALAIFDFIEGWYTPIGGTL
jgi:hypothetical protein